MACDMMTDSNFRYYSEMLSSGFMTSEMSTALMDFRENKGGTLSGMTRFTDHLDDMPAIGYARSSLDADRIPQFLLLMYGHAANYQGRGSFFSTEQQSLCTYHTSNLPLCVLSGSCFDTQLVIPDQDHSDPQWRASLGDIQASFCTPSQTLIASMTAMQLVDSERQNATIWIARAAPRRWYAAAEETETENAADVGTLFGAHNAPSRWGTVGFEVGPQSNGVTAVNLTVEFQKAAGQAAVRAPILMVRVRDPDGKTTLASATADEGGDCEVVEVQPARDIVVVRATPAAAAAMRVDNCALRAHFSAAGY